MQPQISGAGQPKRGRWLLREPGPDSSARLFCLPYSGCGASMYHGWPRFIGQIEVCPVQLPGRENRIREPLPPTYQELASDLAAALLPYLDRPFAFFGHCGSALPGYETSVQLQQRGGPSPARLFVSSQVAPHQGPYGRFLQMSDAELTEEMKTLIHQMGGSPMPALLELSVRVMRADVEANKRYRLDQPVPLHCPITAIGWTSDSEVDPSLMTGWSEYGETVFRVFEGQHYRFLQAPHELCEAIAADMAVAIG